MSKKIIIEKDEVWRRIMIESHYLGKKGSNYGSIAVIDANRQVIEHYYPTVLAEIGDSIKGYDATLAEQGGEVVLEHRDELGTRPTALRDSLYSTIACKLLGTWLLLASQTELSEYFNNKATAELMVAINLLIQRKRPTWS